MELISILGQNIDYCKINKKTAYTTESSNTTSTKNIVVKNFNWFEKAWYMSMLKPRWNMDYDHEINTQDSAILNLY